MKQGFFLKMYTYFSILDQLITLNKKNSKRGSMSLLAWMPGTGLFLRTYCSIFVVMINLCSCQNYHHSLEQERKTVMSANWLYNYCSRWI